MYSRQMIDMRKPYKIVNCQLTRSDGKPGEHDGSGGEELLDEDGLDALTWWRPCCTALEPDGGCVTSEYGGVLLFFRIDFSARHSPRSGK